jgi:uncharacterized membrane protein YeaQ/YmgE (transglycosylase-associated protein family)
MLHWLWVGLVGLVVGALAKLIMPGKDPGGFWVTMLIGVLGSLLASWLGSALHIYGPGENAGFIGGLVGALVLLGAWRLINRSRAG